MSKSFQLKDFILLALSGIVIYFLAPSLDRHQGLFISTSFALVNIISSGVVWESRYRIRYGVYLIISIVTYYILFNDEPWNMIFHGGLFDSSPVPLIVCSIIMTFNGWLLFKNWQARIWYSVITLGAQIPIGIYVGSEYLQTGFSSLAHALAYKEVYSGSWEVWQLEWMLTYYLPVFILSRLYTSSGASSKSFK